MNNPFFNFEKYKLELHGVRLPEIKISVEEKRKINAPIDCNNYTYLQLLCQYGFEKRLKDGQIESSLKETYLKKLQEELDIFRENGLVDYILLTYDIIRWCDENKIPRGRARGSAAASLCLYFLNIVNIDGLKHDLFFTRFVNKARLQSKIVDGVLYVAGDRMPDIDNDISYVNRQRVIEYIETKHSDKTAKILTFGRLTGKLLIKECSKVLLNYNEEQAKTLADMVEKHFGQVEKLKDTYQNSPDFKKWVDEKEENKRCLKTAQKLENLIKQKGQHPSGIVISYYPTKEYIPLELSKEKDLITSYDMYEISNFLCKIDILGLKNSDINQWVCEDIGLNQDAIDISHHSIYEFLQSNDKYYGLFQIEEGLTKDVVLRVKPKNIDQLASCVAISRPGGLSGIDTYVKYVHTGEIKPIHPEFDRILAPTANLILYQESLMAICQQVYKLSPIDADDIRRACGKKDREKMSKWEPVLYQKGKENNIPEEVTKYFWDTCNKSADYLFVKSHAYSYSYMTAINTYLKANYPVQFYTALLKMAKFEPKPTEVIQKIQVELQYFNIKLLPPSLVFSEIEFTKDKGNIRYGLGSIKGVAEKSFQNLLTFRKPYSNKFELFESAKQSKLSVGITSSMIMAGALNDFLVQSRSRLVLEAQLWNLLTPKEKVLALQYGPQFNFDLLLVLKYLSESPNERGKMLIKESRFQTIRNHYEPYKQIYLLNSRNEEFANWFYERKLLGYSYSSTLYDIFSKFLSNLIPLSAAMNLEEKDSLQTIAIVKEGKKTKSKAGKEYIKYEIEDESASTTLLLFGDDKIGKHLLDNEGLVEEEDIVLVTGNKGRDCIFGTKVVKQSNKIYMKLSELKENNAKI